MTVLQNLHTHSTFCDGKDTPEETVKRALALGFDSIGFSEHAPAHFSASYERMLEGNVRYREEITRLKREYAGQIEIFLGLEQEMYAKSELSHYDYVIGSVHYLLMDGEYVGFDRGVEEVHDLIATRFGGNGLSLARAYYAALSTLPAHGNFDIVGHFDLITKLCEKTFLFDADSKEYRAYALEAVDALVKKIPIAEINTGAIARGNRTSPYPAPWILKAWREKGGKIVISSDCHNNLYLAHAFRDAIALARECGYRETQVLTRDGFLPVSLEDMRKKMITVLR